MNLVLRRTPVKNKERFTAVCHICPWTTVPLPASVSFTTLWEFHCSTLEHREAERVIEMVERVASAIRTANPNGGRHLTQRAMA